MNSNNILEMVFLSLNVLWLLPVLGIGTTMGYLISKQLVAALPRFRRGRHDKACPA